jgi:hypothetical protein
MLTGVPGPSTVVPGTLSFAGAGVIHPRVVDHIYLTLFVTVNLIFRYAQHKYAQAALHRMYPSGQVVAGNFCCASLRRSAA